MRKFVLQKVGIWLVALVLGMISFSSFAQESPKTRQAEEDYPWLVQGLQKFNYPRHERFMLATTSGGSIDSSCQEVKSKKYKDKERVR